MSWTLMAGAFMTGLVGGLHCIGMCGGFAAVAASRRRTLDSVLYHGGRWVTYMVLGAAAGALGLGLHALGHVGWYLALVLLLVLVARLLGVKALSFAPMRGVGARLGRLAHASGPAGPAVLGLSTALLPCGLVYTALALPVVSGSPVHGALAMLAFGIGTTPLLGLVSLGVHRSQLWRMPFLRAALAVVLLVVGGWQLLERRPGAPDEPPSCCQTVQE